jgi:hypothetical protein
VLNGDQAGKRGFQNPPYHRVPYWSSMCAATPGR